MKKILPFLILLTAIISSCNSQKDLELDVLSLNIRYDNPADAPNDWPARSDFVRTFITEHSPDIFGLQEALSHQYNYLDTTLDEYRSIGVGRDDGDEKGEMNPVFFRKDRFCTLSYGTFWLSETPGIIGSKGWGAALPRIVTWVELEDRKSSGRFFFFNTHFSHMSDSARLMSSAKIIEQVKDIAGDSPFIITGDFNMLPDSKAYARLTEEGASDPLIIDSYTISNNDPEGLDYTFNGFRDEKGKGRIDYIFVSSGVEVESHKTEGPKQGDLFISDHWPVMVRVKIN